ncbi:sulfatase family protein [Actomonas aquatica]|uniref:Sulfatase n=1 Tax=Actomonas aquatica TaxID=2866162 RepID=A0ABZ1C2T2_9BACT|nr:sulfatase [Opitutus sp. WL0086]WRQ85756.1 sulfatase [Opitutus sp. WL0086]
MLRSRFLRSAVVGLLLAGALTRSLFAAESSASAPRNVVIILSDDHRYDFMSFHEHAPDFLQTPNLDRMAAEGAHLKNAFVTTSLCSPSRASILSGQYAHRHGVVDNTTPIPERTRFFPSDLQAAGYKTAFFGKWHMGESDDRPRPGFDRWLSFEGQGVYRDPLFNIDGEEVQCEGYTTDLLTDYALDWLQQQPADQPFLLYLSHKAVHSKFEPAERHLDAYGDIKIPYPATMARTESNAAGKPRWVQDQRFSWHGVEYPYHGRTDFDTFYRNYAETLLALDENVGRVLDYLEEHGLAENTLVLYLGDNGFLLGEHGLIDKRHAYEASIRIPMLAWCPGYVPAGSTIEPLVRNIDIAPTLLELTGATSSIAMDGLSFLPLLHGDTLNTATTDREFLYEYYWEYAYPQTPTTFALRGDRYKYITYQGIWDKSELYDLQTDPEERHNLIDVPAMHDIALAMRHRLFDRLEADNAMQVPVRRGDYQAGERLLHD